MSLQSAVWLVNSEGSPDGLATVADLSDFLDDFDYSGSHERSVEELDDVRRMRSDLRTLLLAERDEAAGLVNAIMANAAAVPQLVRHDPFDWHLHAIGSDSALAQRIFVETAMAMIDVIRQNEHSRLSPCAAPDCNGVVLDLSRNRSRKFCSTTCGTRVAVAAYRARHR